MGRKEPEKFKKVSWAVLREILCKGTYDCSDLYCDDCILDTPDKKEFKKWLASKLHQED